MSSASETTPSEIPETTPAVVAETNYTAEELLAIPDEKAYELVGGKVAALRQRRVSR